MSFAPKDSYHREGMVRRCSPRAPDTKVFVGCALRTGLSQNISRKERKGRKEKKLISELSVPFDFAQDMLGVRNIRIGKSSALGKFARAAKTFYRLMHVSAESAKVRQKTDQPQSDWLRLISLRLSLLH